MADEDEVLAVMRRGGVVAIEGLGGDRLERVLVQEVDVRLLPVFGLLGVGPGLLLHAADVDGAGPRHLRVVADGVDGERVVVDAQRVVTEVLEEVVRVQEDRLVVRVDHRLVAVDDVALELRRDFGDLVAAVDEVEEEHRGLVVQLVVRQGGELHVARALVVAVESLADLVELVVVDLAQHVRGLLHRDEHRGIGLVLLREHYEVDDLGEAVALRALVSVERHFELPFRVAPEGVAREVLGLTELRLEVLVVVEDALADEREGDDHVKTPNRYRVETPAIMPDYREPGVGPKQRGKICLRYKNLSSISQYLKRNRGPSVC